MTVANLQKLPQGVPEISSLDGQPRNIMPPIIAVAGKEA